MDNATIKEILDNANQNIAIYQEIMKSLDDCMIIVDPVTERVVYTNTNNAINALAPYVVSEKIKHEGQELTLLKLRGSGLDKVLEAAKEVFNEYTVEGVAKNLGLKLVRYIDFVEQRLNDAENLRQVAEDYIKKNG